MRRCKTSCFLLTLMLSVTAGFGHVRLDYPEGGETFFVGDTVLIQWTRLANHAQNNWDLEFSRDGGNTWSSIVENLPIPQLSYEWVIDQEPASQAYIKVIQDNVGGNYESVSGAITILASPVNIKTGWDKPGGYALIGSFPNPFNPSTTINYFLPEASKIDLTIFDLLGNEVITLNTEFYPAGRHSVQWDGRDQTGNDVGTGVYICRLQAGSYSETIKMVYLL